MALQAPLRTEFDTSEHAIAALFSSPVSVAITDPTQPRSAAYAAEAAYLPPMRALRRREFLAGRDALRQAIIGLQLPPCAIPVADDRSPQLPPNVTASLSHSQTMCVAVADLRAHTGGLGIDVEPIEGLDIALWDTVCTRAERARIAQLPHGHRPLAAKRIFCAKEAAYKCQYALSNTLIDFDAFDVTFAGPGQFHATFRHAVGPFSLGDRITGKFTEVEDHFVFVARIPA